MIQEQKPALTIGNRSFSLGQLMFGVLGLIVLSFLVYGMFNNPPAESTFAPTNSFLVLAFMSFAGGLLSFASPCTLPILPAYFAFAFNSGRSTIAANTFAFMLGLATMFSFLGAGASFIGRILFDRQDLILIIGGSLVIIFGIMSLIGKGFTGMQDTGQTKRTASLGGSFMFGLTFAVGWSSCVGPILGIVLSLAATTASVIQGIMLLFIYALGLGLPLMVMSAVFGRASRDSFVWRVMRGKGWERDTPNWAVALLWGFGIWLISMPLIRYAFPTFDIDSNPLIDFAIPIFSIQLGVGLSLIELGLLAIILILAVVAAIAIYGGGNTILHLHSTQLFSGVLFILMGMLLLNSQLAIFNGLVSPEIAEWFAEIEESFIGLFGN